LPEQFRDGSDELLLAAAAAGLGLEELASLFAQMYERARSELPDQDPDRDFADRGLKLATTFGGAGVIHGDLTPECAELVSRVLGAGHRAGGSETGASDGAWLDGDAAGAIACDAAMAPVVTGDVNVDALQDLVRLCVDLDRLRRDGGRDAAGGPDGPGPDGAGP